MCFYEVVTGLSGSSGNQTHIAKLVDRVQGACSAEQLLSTLKACCTQHRSVLQTRRLKRIEAEERQRLRDEQNRAYEESQQLDREREVRVFDGRRN